MTLGLSSILSPRSGVLYFFSYRSLQGQAISRGFLVGMHNVLGPRPAGQRTNWSCPGYLLHQPSGNCRSLPGDILGSCVKKGAFSADVSCLKGAKDLLEYPCVGLMFYYSYTEVHPLLLWAVNSMGAKSPKFGLRELG